MTAPDAPSQTRKRKFPLWAWILSGIALVLLLAVLVLRWALASEFGRNMVESQLESRVFSGQSVSLDGFDGDLFDRISIEELIVSDEDGIWLTARQLELDWSPLSLLGRKLDVDLLGASEIVVDRRPVLPESESKEDDEPGEMPLKAISLSELAIQRIALAEGVVPQAVAGSVHGVLAWTPEEADINLQIEPDNEGGDRLVASINWSASSPLRGQLELDGPAGGLFATLLRLEPEQSIAADFSAEGEPDSVNGQLLAQINGNEWVEFDLAPVDDSHSFEASIDLSRHPLTTELMPRLGSQVDIVGELNLDDPVGSLGLLIQAKGLSLQVTEIETGEESQSARLQLVSEAPDRILGTNAVSLGRLRTDGDVSLVDGILVFNGDILAERIRAESADIERLTGPVMVRYGENKVEVQPEFRAEDLVLRFREDPARLDWLSLSAEAIFDLETSQLRLARTNIETPASFLRANGATTIDGNLPADIRGDIRVNLAEFGLYESGVVQGKWGAVRRGDRRSAFSADLRAQGLSDDEALSDWLGMEVSLILNGQLTDDGAAEIPRFQLVTAAGDLTGTISRSSEGRLNATAEFLTGDSYPLVDTLPGAQVSISANGKPDNLSLRAGLQANVVHLGDTDIEAPKLRFEGTLRGTDLAGQLNLDGQLEGDPLTLSSDIGLQGADWSAAALNGNWRAISVSGGARGEAGDIETFTGDLRLFGDLPQEFPARSVDLTVYREPGDLRISGELTELTSGPLQKSDVAFSVAGTVQEASYDVSLTGDLAVTDILQETELVLSGTAFSLLEDDRNTTGQFQINWGQERVETVRPFRFAQSSRGIEGQLSVSVLDGALDLSLSDQPEERVLLNASEIKLAQLLQALGRAPLDGSAEFELAVADAGSQLRGTLSGQLIDLALPAKDMDPVSFLLDGTLENENLTLQLTTPESQVLGALIDVHYPVTTSNDPMSIAPSDREAGLVTAQIDGRVDNILALVLPDQMLVTGGIDADFRSELPFEPAGLTGQLIVTDGQFEHGELGAVFQDIAFRIDMEDEVLTLAEFSAIGRRGGTLSGSGSMGLNNRAGSNIQLEANQLVVVDRREGRAVSTGTLGLEVVDDQFRVIGDLTLDEGQIYIDRLPSAGVTTLDVQFVDGDTDTEITEDDPPTVLLDIALKAPRRLKINGSGMDAELSLDTKIEGSVDDFSINGRAQIVRGRFDLLGKRFAFVNSSINFAGDPMDARLDIEATRDAGDFTAKVEIGGTPRRPTVTLDAEPSLPEDEVLSRVLFGRSPSQLTGLEAARLAAALAQLSGGGGFDLMGGIEQMAGLDTLDVSQDASGQFTVATGRYLSEDVYLEVKSNASGNAGVSVEWEPRDNISVGAEAVPGEGQNLSVQWKKDFE
ncbi:MAG: hypothetical protein CMK09_14875 [Ponticaulis sp.]|nr:hypothetical protein [Ponticaulis sp.]|tara:strand:+ start:17218 stop:21363 length:4146 start_codon:yes stop_codon:yes gene_type:complete